MLEYIFFIFESRFLVTGNLGYVGKVLTPYIKSQLPSAQIIG